jgi:hypothetical protein
MLISMLVSRPWISPNSALAKTFTTQKDCSHCSNFTPFLDLLSPRDYIMSLVRLETQRGMMGLPVGSLLTISMSIWIDV